MRRAGVLDCKSTTVGEMGMSLAATVPRSAGTRPTSRIEVGFTILAINGSRNAA